MLAKAYTSHLKSKNFEIVFVSSDQDDLAFTNYFGEMPWLALPYDARKINSALSKKYGVQGIPSLVIVGNDGKLISKDGRGMVMRDPKGAWLPTPKPSPTVVPKDVIAASAASNGLAGILGSGPLLATDGKGTLSVAEVVKDAPLIGLYFSAHWCGPCRAFTPKLVTFVEMLSEEGIELPIVFGSSDRDEAAFQEYFSSMPWHAFPHGDARIEALKAKYQVSGIPWLVVLDAEGNLVVNEADEDVPKGTPAYSGWLSKVKKPVKPVTGAPAA